MGDAYDGHGHGILSHCQQGFLPGQEAWTPMFSALGLTIYADPKGLYLNWYGQDNKINWVDLIGWNRNCWCRPLPYFSRLYNTQSHLTLLLLCCCWTNGFEQRQIFVLNSINFDPPARSLLMPKSLQVLFRRIDFLISYTLYIALYIIQPVNRESVTKRSWLEMM